jgi:transposase
MAIIIKVVMMALEGMGVPKYSSKKSKRMYSDHAKIALLVLRQYLNRSYESFSKDLGSMSGALREAAVDKVPDPSTLSKFSARIDAEIIRKAIGNTAKIVCLPGIIAAVDSTGFSCSNASRHYVKRLKEMSGNNDMRYSLANVRDYSKMSLMIDTSSLMIMSADVCPSNMPDVKRLTYLVDDAKETGFSVSYVVADKGYDSENAHRYIRENLRCETMIPIRRKSEPAKTGAKRTRTEGFHRGLMKFNFNAEIYRKRSLVETVNSMIKRNMSDTVYGKNERTRCIEIVCRCVAHNVMRIMDLNAEA